MCNVYVVGSKWVCGVLCTYIRGTAIVVNLQGPPTKMLGILCGLPYLHCILCLQYVNVYVQSNVAALLVLEYRVTSYVDEVEAPPPIPEDTIPFWSPPQY